MGGRRRGGKTSREREREDEREGRGGGTHSSSKSERKRLLKKGKSVSVFVRGKASKLREEKTLRKGKAFVSRLQRGRKEEEKNPTMSTVKRPRGRVSELL